LSGEDFFALLVSGLTTGAIYAMVGVSLNIAYKPTNVFNMAQGGLIMLGMMFTWVLLSVLGLPWILGVPLAMAIVAAVGLVEERIAVAPLHNVAGHSHAWVITTLAFSIILVNAADQIWGADPRYVAPMPGTSLTHHRFGIVGFNTAQIAIIVIAFASIWLVEYFYHHTRLGRAVLAVSEDSDGARLCGINPLRLTMGSFAAGGAFAALTGAIASPILFASTEFGLDLLIKGFIALAIGGLGSNWGALAGAILIACIETLSSVYLSPGMRQIALLAVFLAVLLMRPNGMFGRPGGREV